MRAKTPVQTIAKYDDMVTKELKIPIAGGKPTADVVKTVE